MEKGYINIIKMIAWEGKNMKVIGLIIKEKEKV